MLITLIICITVIVVVSIICYMNYKIQTTNNENLRDIHRKLTNIDSELRYLDNMLDMNYEGQPRYHSWFLGQIGDDAYETFFMELDKNETWDKWSRGNNIKRWAYIDDLLPKDKTE